MFAINEKQFLIFKVTATFLKVNWGGTECLVGIKLFSELWKNQ